VAAASLTGSITNAIGDLGIYAVFLLMVLGALLPVASEVVMPYAGAVAGGAFASQHVVLFGLHIHSHFWAFLAMALAGTLGNVVGSVVGWALGAYGGRPFLEHYGRYIHVTPAKIDRTERWFARWGDAAVFVGWITPLARSFISYAAGIVRMALGRFLLLTVAGCLTWSLALTGVGWAVGANWSHFHHEFRYADYVILALAVLSAAYIVFRAVRTSRSHA
jgi:membrane protein DedA with SNARE-associated domain